MCVTVLLLFLIFIYIGASMIKDVVLVSDV